MPYTCLRISRIQKHEVCNHQVGTTNPQTPDEWMKSNGRSTQVSQEQIARIVQDSCQNFFVVLFEPRSLKVCKWVRLQALFWIRGFLSGWDLGGFAISL